MRVMKPITHIRKNVLGLSQKALADVAGVSQATVSRWEHGALEPNRDEMDLIRSKAIDAGKDWDDRWFFEAPSLWGRTMKAADQRRGIRQSAAQHAHGAARVTNSRANHTSRGRGS
jgi:transcriptional regulator with XRE-family HTH domain